MRIVGGRLKGRPLDAPPGRRLRPTSDRARESVFNILTHREDIRLDGAIVLDGFAGTGAMGIEALSRGAARVTFMDNDAEAISFCRLNLEHMGEGKDSARVQRADCLSPPQAPEPCTLVFLDPPYGVPVAASALTALHDTGWIADGALCVVELGKKDAFDPPPGFTIEDDRRYGAARMVFLKAEVNNPK